MNEEIIVAVYDTEAHADAAVRDRKLPTCRQLQYPRHAGGPAASGTPGSSGNPAGQGFWSSLFGGDRTTTPPSTTAVLKAARRW